jgi:hypothetical protein
MRMDSLCEKTHWMLFPQEEVIAKEKAARGTIRLAACLIFEESWSISGANAETEAIPTIREEVSKSTPRKYATRTPASAPMSMCSGQFILVACLGMEEEEFNTIV